MNLEFEDNITKRGAKQRNRTRTMETGASHADLQCPKTPSRKTESTILSEGQRTPVTSSIKQSETPRRSARKSIKPLQDYEEIVNCRIRKINENFTNNEKDEKIVEAQPKWTPAKVGRVSEKRSTRKGRSGKKSKLLTVDNVDPSQNENKEKESEQELINKINDNKNSAKTVDDSGYNLLNNTLNVSFAKASEPEKSFSVKTGKLDLIELGIAPIDFSAEEEVSSNKNIKFAEVFNVDSDNENKEKEPDEDHINKVKDIKISEKTDENKMPTLPNNTEIEPEETLINKVEDNLLNLTLDKPIKGEEHNPEKIFSVKTGNLDLVEMRVVSIVCNLATPNDCNAEVEDAQLSAQKDKIINKPENNEFTQNLALTEVLNVTDKKDDLGKISENEKSKNIVISIESDCEISEEKNSKVNEPVLSATFNKEQIITEQVYTNISELDDMPSLILCDEDEDEVFEPNKTFSPKKADDTFNSSDCMIISPTDEIEPKFVLKTSSTAPEKHLDSPLQKAEKKVKDIQTKYFTPNKLLKKDAPKIIITSELGETSSSTTANNIRKTPLSGRKLALKSTPSPVSKPNDGVLTTPRSIKTKSGYRFPTPFKSKNNFSFSKSDKENLTQTSLLNPLTRPSILLTTLEPKDFVLHGRQRKRSLSVTVEVDRRNRKAQNVTFHSPANHTTTTEDIDRIISKSAFKTDNSKQKQINPVAPRKRSISLDENVLRLPSKLPRRVNTPTKSYKSSLKPTSRTKLPNFKAIHQKEYEKMENLVEYVARKAERAQNLTNSAVKVQNDESSKSPCKTKSAIAKALPLQPGSSNVQDKLKERHARHVALFKGRSDPKTEVKRKNKDLIRGVRSNRRFDLLMQHRKVNGN